MRLGLQLRVTVDKITRATVVLAPVLITQDAKIIVTQDGQSIGVNP
jgi:hypothetical protein